VDLAHRFSVDLNLIPPSRVRLVLSGTPSKDESRQRLEALVAAGAIRTAASRSNILAEVSNAAKSAGEQGLLVSFCASHGVRVGETGYVLSRDALRDQLEETGVKVSSLERHIRESKSRRKIAFVDTCQEEVFQDGSRSVGSGLGNMNWLAAWEKAEGQVVVYAAKAGGFSYESDDLQQGVFTHFLLRGLGGEATAPGDGITRMENLINFVETEIKANGAPRRCHMGHHQP
jgi:uncharacterized caspase-like protein